MEPIRVYFYNKEKKRTDYYYYNMDTAVFICNVPGGRLYKRTKKCTFYIYNPRGKTLKEQFTEVSYHEAKELIKKHGTREQYCEYFSILNADGTYKKGRTGKVIIDEIHRLKLMRTAAMLNMTMSGAVQYLIDKYDGMDHDHLVYSGRNIRAKQKRNKNKIPEDFLS